ncbi:MAG: hypothetical protein ACD_39C01660G0001 [uncultured bacterium]|nr:MAG: hypothetical protein ACD_39C01660G0001 [uncultured bacterium]
MFDRFFDIATRTLDKRKSSYRRLVFAKLGQYIVKGFFGTDEAFNLKFGTTAKHISGISPYQQRNWRIAPDMCQFQFKIFNQRFENFRFYTVPADLAAFKPEQHKVRGQLGRMITGYCCQQLDCKRYLVLKFIYAGQIEAGLEISGVKGAGASQKTRCPVDFGSFQRHFGKCFDPFRLVWNQLKSTLKPFCRGKKELFLQGFKSLSGHFFAFGPSFFDFDEFWSLISAHAGWIKPGSRFKSVLRIIETSEPDQGFAIIAPVFSAGLFDFEQFFLRTGFQGKRVGCICTADNTFVPPFTVRIGFDSLLKNRQRFSVTLLPG